MKLTLVRHGETVENENKIVQGQSRGILNDAGLMQAAQTGIKLKGKKLDLVICSDLDRWIKTAEQIKLNSGIEVDLYSPEVRERSFGDFEGKSSLNLDWGPLSGDFMTRKPPNSESNIEFSNRVTSFINDLLDRHPVDDILIITHGGVIRILQYHFSDESLEKIFSSKPENGGIYEFEINTPLNLML